METIWKRHQWLINMLIRLRQSVSNLINGVVILCGQWPKALLWFGFVYLNQFHGCFPLKVDTFTALLPAFDRKIAGPVVEIFRNDMEMTSVAHFTFEASQKGKHKGPIQTLKITEIIY